MEGGATTCARGATVNAGLVAGFLVVAVDRPELDPDAEALVVAVVAAVPPAAGASAPGTAVVLVVDPRSVVTSVVEDCAVPSAESAELSDPPQLMSVTPTANAATIDIALRPMCITPPYPRTQQRS